MRIPQAYTHLCSSSSPFWPRGGRTRTTQPRQSSVGLFLQAPREQSGMCLLLFRAFSAHSQPPPVRAYPSSTHTVSS